MLFTKHVFRLCIINIPYSKDSIDCLKYIAIQLLFSYANVLCKINIYLIFSKIAIFEV